MGFLGGLLAKALPFIPNIIGLFSGKKAAESAAETQAQAQVQTNESNAEQAQKQMDFQERMSSTAHEREVKDLIKAGLNPLLSTHGGASSPSGSAAVFQNPKSGYLQGMTNAVSSASAITNEMRALQGTLALQRSQGDLNRANAAAALAQAQATHGRVSLPGFYSGSAKATGEALRNIWDAIARPLPGVGQPIKHRYRIKVGEPEVRGGR